MGVLSRLDGVRFGKTDWQMRLKARLWQPRRPTAAPSDEVKVLFAIPLVSRRRAESWDTVEANLADTLASFQRQTDPNWQVVICGQDAPTLPDDSRVRFVEARISDKFYDKGDKRRRLVAEIAQGFRGDAYYMQYDADDILHPDFVAHLRTDNNGRGYVVDKGYFVSLSAPGMAPLDRFNRHCGSSSAVYVDFRESRAHEALLVQHRSHIKIAEISALYGQPLEPVPFRAVLYMTGHGQNMVKRRGKLDERTEKFLQRQLSPEEAAGVCATFGVPELAASLTRPEE